mgnify:FL=1
MYLSNSINKEVVIKHINNVLEDKTNQFTDHLINKVSLESKLDSAKTFTKAETDRFESLSKKLAGKTQKEHEKFVSKLKPLETIRMREYIENKNDNLNLAFAIRSIKEHEDFLKSLEKLKNDIEKESTNSSGSTKENVEVKIIN